MKQYAKKSVAQMQAGSLTKRTGVRHLFKEIDGMFHVGTEAEFQPKEQVKKAKMMVEVTVMIVGGDDKYYHVENGTCRFRIAKSRARIVADSMYPQITLSMTQQYRDHRPELKQA